MTNPLLSAALAYVSLGWYIFPCLPGTKQPATKHGCRDASNDPAQIERWWSTNPSYNIGLACGKASGVYVVDVDVDPAKRIDGPASMMAFPALPKTAVSETPRGGFHWLFRSDDPPANKNAFRRGVDIRADGYYIVLAPSVHPNGGVYEWREGASPWDIPLAEYPDFMRPKKEAATAPWQKPAQSAPRPAATSMSSDVESRAVAYLLECEPAMEGFAGHDKLLWAARAMVKGFSLSEDVAHDLLASHFNPRCIPPWNLADPKDAKDFRRKVTEAARTPAQKADGWLLNEYHVTGDDRLFDLGNQLAERLLAGTPKTNIGFPISGQSDTSAGNLVDLLRPPGLVGDVAEWLESTALCSQPWLNLGAAITFCGAIMGRKVRSDTDLRTNIYAMAVAETSAGKDHARKALRKLASEAGCLSMLGGEDVTSDSAIATQLESNPVTLFLWDEIGHLLKSLQQDKNNVAMSKIVPMLMMLYSSASEQVIGKGYAGNPGKIFDQPHLSIYGTGVPGRFMNGISADQLSDGFLARLLVFISLTRPLPDIEKGKKKIQPAPAELIEKIRELWLMRVAAPQSAGNIEAETKAHQVTITTSDEAEAIFTGFHIECHRKLTSPQDKDKNALWGKAWENARKLSLICAVGDYNEDGWGIQIEARHATWACGVVTKIIDDFLRLISDNMAETQFERDKLYVLKAIERAGEAGLRKSGLTRATRRIPPSMREMIVRDLIESGEVNSLAEGSGAVRFHKFPWGLNSEQHQ